MANTSRSLHEDSPEWMQGLDEAQRARLTTLLDGYLSKLENGERQSLSELSLDNEDLIQPLRLYIDQIDRLYGGAKGNSSDGLGGFDALGIEVGGEAKRLGDFLLIREIGRGGMGVVYEAIQESLSRKVAIKLLPLPAMFSKNQVARFQNEAQAAAILQHPNIVPVYAIGIESGIHFYAMPLIEGQSLDEVVSQLRYAAPPGISTQWLQKAFVSQGKLVPLIRMIAEAADALQAAHEVGIVHRDIKPSNLMLDLNGQIYVADFGLARMESDKSLTKTGELIGTVRYMSPEQASGRQALVDHRTDIYSLGATLYELIALHPAIAGEDGPTLFQAIEKSEPISLRKLRKEVPMELELVISMAMAKRREDRYFSAGEFANDLRCVLAKKPTLAKPPTMGARIAKWTANNRGYFVAASLILALTTAAIAWRMQIAKETQAEMNEMVLFSEGTVNRMSTNVAQQLDGVPGTEEFRAIQLRESIAYYQGIIKKTKANPFFRQLLAEANNRLGSAVQSLHSPSESIAHFRKAQSLFDQLRKENPSDVKVRMSWARNQDDLGLALSETGELEEGRVAIEQAIKLQRSLHDSAPGIVLVLDLAKSLNDMGMLHQRLGETSEARKAFDEGYELSRKALETLDEQHEYWTTLHSIMSNTKNNLASTYDADDPETAAKLYGEALQLRGRGEDLSLLQSSSIAVNYNNLALALARVKKFPESKAAYTSAIEIQRRIVANSPSVHKFRRELATSLNNFGWLCLETGELPSGQAVLEEGVQIQAKLLAESPEDPSVESELGGIYNNLALLYQRQGSPQKGAQAFVDAIQHQRKAVEAAPNEKQYRDFLNRQYYNFAALQKSQKEWQEAANIALLRMGLYEKDPANLFSVAQELAELATEAFRLNGEDREVRSIAEKAIEAIRKAKKVGFKVDSAIIETEPFSILLR